MRYGACFVLGIVGTYICLAQLASGETPQRVEQSALREVMQAERDSGYDLTATSNAVRLQASVITGIARSALQRDSFQAPLLIGHEEYFRAYLETTGLTEEQAPIFARTAHDHAEDLLIEYRRERVIRRLESSPAPALAVTVCGGWKSPTPERYVYDDRSSIPHIRSMHERVHSFRLVEIDGMLVHDEIHGIGGRATSGALGVIFSILGDAHAVQSRMRVTCDGLLLVRATAKKGPIRVSRTVTVTPDGRTSQGVPPNRSDLAATEEQLASRVRIDYVPFVCRPGESLESRTTE